MNWNSRNIILDISSLNRFVMRLRGGAEVTENFQSCIENPMKKDARRRCYFHQRTISKTIPSEETVDASFGKGQPYQDFIAFIDQQHHQTASMSKFEIMKEKFREKFRVYKHVII